MGIETRIKEVRKHLDLTQTEFGEVFGVSRNVINSYERGVVAPIPLFIESLCTKYGVDQTWLETGEGEMFRAPSVDEELAAFVADVISDDNEFKKRVFYAMSRMDDAAWDAFERFWNDMQRTGIEKQNQRKER